MDVAIINDAEKLGREAYLKGDDLSTNPYNEEEHQHDEWDDGYGQEEFNDSEYDIGN